ncbi:hypothetical protein HQQ80_10540 [Microbacteriaceae bacterium VKM Ac-2855]|nr:hypothetical protein [Microbacteriaceae bacterium VKM Ac-2855]
MAPVIETTPSELAERRSDILKRLGLTEANFWELKSTRTLNSDEWEAKEELEAIEFLLGEHPSR